MLNNKLTAKYIKDIFRFMKMYNISEILTQNKKYKIKIDSDTYFIKEFENGVVRQYKDKDLSSLIERFKAGEMYGNDVTK